MSEIIIKNLRLFGYHGVNAEEKIKGQEFLFNIIVVLERDIAGEKVILKNDNIKNTVNYSDIISIVKDINSSRFDLLETLSGIVAEKILSFSPLIEKVSVRVEKTSPPITEKIESVGVETTASRKNRSGIFLALGSNLKDREKNLRDAVVKIEKNNRISVTGVSSIYETEPMYLKDQGSFLNVVLEAEADDSLEPFELLGFLKGIEYSLGRKESNVRYGPRVIDIDILYFGDVEIFSDFLIIPHPRITERRFVLLPLQEIAPDFKIKGISVSEFIKKSDMKERVEKLKNW